MYRISVTSLEKFRRFRDNVSSYDTEESLLETLSGEFKGNAYTQVGTAFHSIVENGGIICQLQNDGNFIINSDDVNVKMNYGQVTEALNYRNMLSSAFYEVASGKDFQTSYFPIYVGGRIDVIHGLHVRDIKTKYSPIKSIMDYMDSCQWRLYLEFLSTDTFYFDVFQFEKYDKEKHGVDVSPLSLAPRYEIECLRYDTMEQDNQKLVNDFCEYIKIKNLFHLLKHKE